MEEEGRIAEKARDGFHRGVITGLLGMALAGFTERQALASAASRELLPDLEEYYRGKIPAAELRRIVEDCRTRGVSCHDALMERCGWPAIPYDGQLLVYAPGRAADGRQGAGARRDSPITCASSTPISASAAPPSCASRCARARRSRPDADGVPVFDREKCVHCGACLWNCLARLDDDPPRGNIAFRAGAGGLHSNEN